jgi:hypothetical protein
MKIPTLDRPAEAAPASVTATQRMPWIDRVKQQLDHLATRSASITAVDPASGMIRDSRMVLPLNPWKMHVARATAQTLTTGGYTTIVFDAVVPFGTYDTANGYNSSTGEYAIPITGYYTMGAILNAVMPAVVVEQFAYLSIFVNGVERRRGHGERYVNSVPSVNTISTTIANSDYYMQGDLLTIRCFCFSGGANPATPAAAIENYWTLHLISG